MEPLGNEIEILVAAGITVETTDKQRAPNAPPNIDRPQIGTDQGWR